MGMFVPRGSTWMYSSTLSDVIRSRVTRAGGGARLTAALYHPLIRCQASRRRGGSNPNSVSTSDPPSSVRRFLSYLKLNFMAHPNILSNTWYIVISWRAETLLLKSLHFVAEIHTFFRAS